MDSAIGPWALLEPLPSHGPFQTFKASHTQTQATALLRTLPAAVASQPGLRDAFFDDLLAARAVQHAGVAQVLDVGELPGGALYFASAWVDGESLAQLLAAAPRVGQLPLSPAHAVALLLPVLEAVEALHRQRVLLRELSPEALRVEAAGQVVLTDVGFVRTRRRVMRVALGHTYVSPEQARGQSTDERSDVFVLGLLAFELLCGRLPAEGEGPEVLSRIALGELDTPQVANPKLPAALAEVLSAALAANSGARLASVAALREGLLAALGGAPSTPEQLQRFLALLRAQPAVVEQPAAPQLPALPEPAAPPAFPLRRRGQRVRLVVGLAGGAALLGGALMAAAQLPFLRPPPRAAPRSMQLAPGAIVTKVESSPPGAEVTLDGELQSERTPFTFTTVPSATHQVSLRRGTRIEKATVHNTRTLWLDLDDSALPRLEQYPPEAQAKVSAAPPAAVAAAAPLAATPHQVRGAPALLALTAAHHVSLDKTMVLVPSSPARLTLSRLSPQLLLEVPSLPPDDATLLEPQPALRQGKASVWALAFKDSQVVRPQLLPETAEGLSLPAGAEYRLALFARGVRRLPTFVFVEAQMVPPPLSRGLTLTDNDVVQVPYDKSLTVTGLDTAVRYAVRAHVSNTKAAPAPALVMIAGTPAGDEVTVFEHEAVVVGASQLTFAVPVLDPSAAVPDIEVSVTAL
jgi:serine/threonine-protein kinase